MKRRTVFKTLALASAAAWVLPSCTPDPKKVSIALNRLEVTNDQEKLLGDIAATMIPATDSPGAREVGAHLFALVMVDDCLSKTDQQKFVSGMRNFDNAVKKVTGRSFAKAQVRERSDILRAFEGKLDSLEEDTRTFYAQARGYIIQGYTTSQHFLTDVKPYQLVPGPHYNGCAPLLASNILS